MLKLIKILLLIVGALLLSCCMQSKDINTPAALDESVPTLSVEESDDPNAISATGIYTGNVDEDSINIKLDNMPQQEAYTSLDFSKESFEMFKMQEINPNEKVKIQYLEREDEPPLILTIQRTSE
jgi:hypothetical protein